MTDFSNDIKRYLNGEMTPAERHALEKKALSDPFLADALEGSDQISSRDFSADINVLHTLIDQRVKQDTVSISFWTWGLRLAAGVLLILITTYTAWYLLDEKPSAPALSSNEKQKSESLALLNAEDSTFDSARNHLALSEPVGESKSAKSSKPSVPAPTEVTAEEAAVATPEDYAVEEISKPTPISESKSIAGAAPRDSELSPVIVAEAKKEIETVADDLKSEEATERSAKKADAKKRLTPTSQSSSVLSGKVIAAEDGSPLPGVNVVIKGTTVGTVTDVAGNYTLENTTPSSTLVYSFIGLQSKEVPVGERQIVDVEMNLDVTQLSEIVVTGYGYSEKSETTLTVDLAHPSIGTKAYKKYLEENLHYPQLALDTKVEGRVTVEFFVELDGSLSGFTLVRGIGGGCDEELIRLIKEGPPWLPTKKDGVAIRDKARIRLKFTLPKE